MARLKREEIEEIVERDLPGYKIVPESETEARPVRAEPDEAGADIEALRRKYFGEEALASDSASVSDADEPEDSEENADDALIAVQPEKATDPYDHTARPKTVVVSGKDRRIIGSQG